MHYILASASPRRKELLTLAGIDFAVCPAEADETLAPGVPPEQAPVLLAARKAQAVAATHPAACVIAADTIVTIDGKILGKPRDKDDAAAMLRLLSGREHRVVTGVCLRQGAKTHAFAHETVVHFYPLRDDEIAAYIATGEPMDKAGAYGIQGKGGLLAARLEGDYYNVVGLPIARLLREMAIFLGEGM
ncbi:MAG: Maf family protein [Oscillospiraceae bacterium]|nr:Maf family protein [Oscillospiraceae bacterium]